MTKPSIPWDAVPVTIGGRDLYLRFSLASMVRLQSMLEVKSLRDVTAMVDQLNPRKGEGASEDWVLDVDLNLLHMVLWGGVLECLAAQGDRVTTRDSIAAAIRLHDIPLLLGQIVVAIAVQFAPKPAQPDNPDPLAGGPAAVVTPPPSPTTPG